MTDQTLVYISSWARSSDGSDEYGLSVCSLCGESGELRLIETVEPTVLFNVTCLDRQRGVLYALNEENELPGLRAGGGGRIFAFRIDPASGRLTPLCVRETWCPSPSYLSLDASGRFLIVSNHGSKAAITRIGQDALGNYYPIVEHDDTAVELFSLREDGSIDRLLDVVRHTGSGPERRQLTAHPHSVVMSPSGALFAVCDKGNDTVRLYRLDDERGRLVPPIRYTAARPAPCPATASFIRSGHGCSSTTKTAASCVPCATARTADWSPSPPAAFCPSRWRCASRCWSSRGSSSTEAGSSSTM